MRRAGCRRLGWATCWLGSVCGLPAAAQESDGQMWLTASAIVPLDKTTSAQAMGSQRFRETAVGGNVWLLRGIVERKIAPVLALAGGLTYVETATAHEWRANQQATLTFHALQFRTQLEEQFFEGAPRPQLRFRERAQVNWPAGKSARVSLAAEWLYVLRPPSPAGHARTDQWRLLALYQRNFAPGLDISIGSGISYSPRAGTPDRIGISPQFIVTKRF